MAVPTICRQRSVILFATLLRTNFGLSLKAKNSILSRPIGVPKALSRETVLVPTDHAITMEHTPDWQVAN